MYFLIELKNMGGLFVMLCHVVGSYMCICLIAHPSSFFQYSCFVFQQDFLLFQTRLLCTKNKASLHQKQGLFGV